MTQAEIKRLLPAIFQRTVHEGNPLDALLGVMSGLLAPSEAVVEHLDTYFDPYRAPDSFIPYLAGWVDLDRLFVDDPGDLAQVPPFPTGTGRLRELVAAAAYLSRWRGTAKGLLRFLEIATDAQGFTIDEDVPGAGEFYILVRAPKETAIYAPLIRRIIELEKPAYVTYGLEFAQ